MKVISIDTSLGVLEVGAYKGNGSRDTLKEVFYVYDKSNTYPVHLEKKLPKAMTNALEGLGGEADLVVVNIGPGSYTGLRSAISFLNGWWLGLEQADRPAIVGISGLTAIKTYADTKDTVGQEERNGRIWALGKGAPVILRVLPRASKTVNIGSKDVAMARILAYTGISEYKRGKKVEPTELRPIYGQKSYESNR